MTLPPTPSQTIGPFFAVGLPWPDGPDVVADGSPGACWIGGRVLDGAGDPVPDALVETWQADPQGRFAHPDDVAQAISADKPGDTVEVELTGGAQDRTVDVQLGTRP